MPFGDVAEVVEVIDGGGKATATYATATPAADDLNVASHFELGDGASGVPSVDTAGFTEAFQLQDVGNDDWLTAWAQVATGSGSNTVTCGLTGSAGSLLVLMLVRGAFAATPKDLSGGVAASTADPTTTGTSGSSTAQADEFMVGAAGTRGSAGDLTAAWDRLGTATPTTDLTEQAEVSDTQFGVHDLEVATQLLTATGTVGISRPNTPANVRSLGYVTYKKAAAGGAFSIDAQPGAFILTGVVAGAVAGRVIDAQPAVYSVTGVDASLVAERVLSADPGSFTVTGVDAAIVADRLINAVPGSFILTGFVADLVLLVPGVFEINAEPGTFIITGVDAALVSGRAIDGQPAAFIVTGVAAQLTFSGAAPAPSALRLVRRDGSRTLILGRRPL